MATWLMIPTEQARQRGQGKLEYALILSALVIALLIALYEFGPQIAAQYHAG